MTGAHEPLLVTLAVGPIRIVMACEGYCIVLFAPKEHGGSPVTLFVPRGCPRQLALLGVWEFFRFEVDRSCGSKDTERSATLAGCDWEWLWSHDGMSY